MPTIVTKECFFVILAVFTVAVPGFASSVLVSNASFETLPVGGLPSPCGTGCSYSSAAIPGWTGGAGQFQPGTPATTAYFTSLSDGPTSAYASSGTISQTVGATVQLGAVYTLLVDIGYRLDTDFGGTADLLVNGIAYAATGIQPVRGTFGTFSATYTGLLADVGQSITIELQSNAQQGNFDNVRLDESPIAAGVPEPTSFLLIAPALMWFVKARRQRSI